MLELNQYSIHDIENINHFFLVTYVVIDEIYQYTIPDHIKFRRNHNQAKLSDSEIITIALVGELHGVPSEHGWYNYVKKNFNDLFPNLCDRTRFNRLRRNLNSVIGAIRQELIKIMNYAHEQILIIDSMPVHACEFGRAKFSKCFKDLASYGYCASKKETYYGFKFHALVTPDGFITNFILTAANVDDRQAIDELMPKYSPLFVLGDKGYVSQQIATRLQKDNITLLALKRDNARDAYPKKLRNWISKHRRRIETSFAQLSDQLSIGKVRARSKSGLLARTNTKVLAHNVSYYINSCLNQKVGKIKGLIFG